MISMKKWVASVLIATFMIQSVSYTGLGITDITAVASAKNKAEIVNSVVTTDDMAAYSDPEWGRYADQILLDEKIGISEYAVRALSIDGNSPFMGNTPYFHADQFAGRNIVHGIDVSKYQYDIDWQAVKGSGVDYAFIRAGYRGYGAAGGMGADPYFVKNMEGAIMAGIHVGVYFFSQATTEEEAIEEAQYTLDKIAGYPISLPVVIDFEYASVNGKAGGRLYDAKLTKEEATKVCLAFCETIENAGYEAMLYANAVMLNNNLYADSISSRYKIWLAQYSSMSSYTGNYDFWQYTSKGTVNGIKGNVDCNFWYQKPGEELGEIGGAIIQPGKPVELIKVDKITGVTSTERTDVQVHLVWDSLSDVDGYEVYRYNITTGVYDKITTIPIASISTYTDTNLMPGTTYDYKIRGYKKNTNTGEMVYGEYSEGFAASTAPKRVTGFHAGSRTENTIHLQWDWIEEITGYQVFRYNVKTKKFDAVTELLDGVITEFTDIGLEPGMAYDYTIKTYINDGTGEYWSDETEPITVRTAPDKVEELVVAKAKKKKIKLGWQQTEGADGYQIYRYDKRTKTYELVKTITSGEKVQWINKKLQKNKSYQYRIKAYIQEPDGSLYTGEFSEAVTGKTKK